MKNFGVYILKSGKNGRYYIGSTDDMERRIKEHNLGKVPSTKNIKPLQIEVFIKCPNLTEAKKSEYRLKRYKRTDILAKVIKDGVFPWNHAVVV